MKKLLIALTAVATGLFASTAVADAEALPTSVGFDTLTAGEELVVDGDGYWEASADPEAKMTVTEWVPAEMPNITFPDVARGDGETEKNYLTVKTTFGKPLVRKAFASGTPTVTDGKIFFDSMVKFTAMDEDPADGYVGSDDKLIVYVKDLSEDLVSPQAATNLYVIAKDNVTYNLGKIDIDVWHRLTIKAVKAYTDKPDELAFTIYVDKQPKDVKEGAVPTFDTSKLTTQAKGINNAKRLFPAINVATTITSVGFDGQGCIDDLVFADTVEDTWADENDFLLTKGENITSYTWTSKSNGVVVDSDTVTGDALIACVNNMTVEISDVVFADGKWTLAADTTNGNCEFADGVFFNFGTASASATLIAEDKTPRVSVKIGEAAPVTYPSLAKAFEAINALPDGAATIAFDKEYYPEGIQLGTFEDASGSHTEATLTTEAAITLDLAGCEMIGPADIEENVIESAGELIIVDTVGGGKIVPNTGNVGAVVVYDNNLSIAGGTFEGAIAVNNEGGGEGAIAITGGSFDYATSTDNEGKFKFALTTDYVAEKDNETNPKYWVVKEAPKAGVVVTTTHAAVAGVKSGDTLAAGATITFTATADTNYTLSSVKIGETDQDTSGSYEYTVTAADVEAQTLNITVVAAATEWTITYLEDDEETTFATDTYNIENRAMKELNAGVRDGYTFNGWGDLDAEYTPVTSLAEKTGNLKLVGSWTELKVVAKINDNEYYTFADAFAAAVDGDTITLQDDYEGQFYTGNFVTENKFTTGLTIDLNGKTWTLTGTSTAHERLWEDRCGNAFTIKNGSLVAEPDSAAPQSVAFYTYAETLEFNNVALDFSGLDVSGDATDPRKMVPIVSQNGNVKFTGTTTVKLASGQRLVTLLDRANEKYVPGTLTLDVNGTLPGDILLYSACTIAVGENTTLSGVVYTGTSANSGFEPAGALGAPFKAMVGAILPKTGSSSTNLCGGRFYATLADANDAIATTEFAKNIIVLNNDEQDGFAVAAGTVNFEIPSNVTFTATTSLTLNGAKVALAEGGTLVAPAVLDIAANFVAPAEGKAIKVAGNGPYTYTVGDAVNPVIPGEDVDIPSGETAQSYADKINEDPTLKAKLLKAPCELEAADLATYQALFVATPNAAGTGVTFELAPTAAEELAADATADAAEALTGDSISIKPVKGLYYGLKEAGALDSMKVTDVELATGEAIEFKPNKTGNAAFWQVIVSPTAIEMPVE